MQKKHFIATHTFISDETKKEFFEMAKGMSSKDFLIEGGEDQFFHTMCAEMDYYITPNDGNNDIYANISYVD